MVWAALLAVYLFWGSTYVGIRIAIATMPPFLMASARFLIAGAILYAWCRLRGHGAGVGWRHWGASFVIGSALAVGNGGVVWGEQYIPSGITSILVATVPFWMVLIGLIMFREPIGCLVYVGLAVGFSGLMLLVAPTSDGAINLLAAIVVLVALVGWASGSVFQRSLPMPREPLVSAAQQLLAMALVLGVAGLVSGEASNVHPGAISTASVLAVAYLIVFGSLVGFTSYIWLLKVAPISTVSTYAYVNPVVALLLGWVLLGEPITLRTLVACAIILSGVALIVLDRSRTSPAAIKAG
jgi:drug/metabolite transporter (DMT)-like permease